MGVVVRFDYPMSPARPADLITVWSDMVAQPQYAPLLRGGTRSTRT